MAIMVLMRQAPAWAGMEFVQLPRTAATCCPSLGTVPRQLQTCSIQTDARKKSFSHLIGRFMGIAEQMGRTLQRTSISVNIKERLDFSCALFGPDGDLVANAPHLPVHLGAMSEAVKAQVRIPVLE